MDDLIPKKANGQSGADGNQFLRTEKIYLQVNPKELATIRANARNDGYNSTAQYVRQQAISGGSADNPVTLKRHYIECQHQMAKIGNNINQIARHVNQTKALDQTTLTTLRSIERTVFLLLTEAHRKVESGK